MMTHAAWNGMINAILAWILVFAPTTSAQELGSLGWFEQEWEQANAIELPDGVFMQYSIVLPVEGDEQDLARLAELVEGKPDHPARREYELLRNQFEYGPRTVVYRLWYQSKQEWRLSTTLAPGDPFEYTDTTLDEDLSWTMTPRELRLISPESPPEGMDPTSQMTGVPSYYRTWVGWGFGRGPLGIEPATSRVNAGQWTATSVSENGSREYRYDGVVEGDRIRLDSVTTTRSEDNPNWVGAERQFTDWRYSPFAERWIAGAVTASSSVYNQSYILHELRALEDGEWDSVSAVPDTSSADPIRGVPTFVSIVDLHPNARHVDVVNPDGTTSRSNLPDAPAQKTTNSTLQFVGWIGVGLVVGLLLFIRLRRAGRS